MLHTQAQDGLFFRIKTKESVKIWPRKEETCRLSSFPKCVAGMQLDPGITVNYCAGARSVARPGPSRSTYGTEMFSDSVLSILPYEHEASAGNGVAARLPAASHPCPFLAVRPEGANDQWRKILPRELSIDLVADERLGRVTGRAGASLQRSL